MDQVVTTHSPSIVPPLHESPVSPLDAVLHKTADRLKTLRLHRVAGMEMSKSDAQAMVADLLDIARLMDPVILSIGNYAAQFLPGIDLELFTDQLRGALEGNATHEICATFEKRVEDLTEARASARVWRRGQCVRE